MGFADELYMKLFVPAIVKEAGLLDEYMRFDDARRAFQAACEEKLIKKLAELVHKHAPGVRALKFGWLVYPDPDDEYGLIADRQMLDTVMDKHGKDVLLVDEIRRHYESLGKHLTSDELTEIVGEIRETATDTADLLEQMYGIRLGIIHLCPDDK